MARQEAAPLRRGWTTGACAAAAARAAFAALLTGEFPDPVTIRLPRGQQPSFPLALAEFDRRRARAPASSRTRATIPMSPMARRSSPKSRGPRRGSGIAFAAGEGVGTVTRPGLQLGVGEPAINPAPRAMIREMLADLAEANGAPPPDVTVTVAIPGGERLAEKTMNARLGIVGGLSVLGTTGIVVPYSCASWIHSIQRGIDVARAAGLDHIAAATGTTSERAVQRFYALPDHALIDMGDFVGGTLKYLRRRPVARLTLAGGFAKMAKLAAGHLDLHSSRSQVDLALLCEILASAGAGDDTFAAARGAETAGAVLDAAGRWRGALADGVARRARGGGARDAVGRDRGRGRDRRSRRRFSDAGRRVSAKRLLILGGTGEAAALARAALASFGERIEVTTALGRAYQPARADSGPGADRRFRRRGRARPISLPITRSTG